MKFEEVLAQVLDDSRSQRIPILYLVQILIICEDKHLFKEAEDVRKLLPDEPD